MILSLLDVAVGPVILLYGLFLLIVIIVLVFIVLFAVKAIRKIAQHERDTDGE